MIIDKNAEWLEADGVGGYASGTVSGQRSRRYHALLLVATTPPTGRVVLVNGFDAWIETPRGRFAISSQRSPPDVVYPDGAQRLHAFSVAEWPHWTYELEDGTRVEQILFVVHGEPIVVLSWKLLGRQLLGRQENATLALRPFVSGRDYHSLHRENRVFRFDAKIEGQRVDWHPYPGIPGITALSNGEYSQEPLWYRGFLYEEERVRGLDHIEDLASPGTFRWDLARDQAILILCAEKPDDSAGFSTSDVQKWFQDLRTAELHRRRDFPSLLDRSADAYIVRRGTGKTIVAGYPWFTDWGRDTFIALRGLCLATGRIDDARQIFLSWSEAVSEGMLPNRFTDTGGTFEYNSVDASLWFVVVAHDYLKASERARVAIPNRERDQLLFAIEAILTGYSRGTRHGIRLDRDGLIAAGEPGVQLTWMDAKVGDWVVTPRIGKPVELQALWLNALWVACRYSSKWVELFDRGVASFRSRFWNDDGAYLYDVVDADHEPGKVDTTCRPNQIFAVGGLPLLLLDNEQARRVVDSVEDRLWTPLGLRSLDPLAPAYAPRYEGNVRDRDAAYHQGTVWPWLIGPFVEAWVRVRGARREAIHEARKRFVKPLLRHLDEAGLGHISEIADGDPPHTPRGCPFQAWSLGEVLRLSRLVLSDSEDLSQRKRVRGGHALRALERALKAALQKGPYASLEELRVEENGGRHLVRGSTSSYYVQYLVNETAAEVLGSTGDPWAVQIELVAGRG